MTMQAVMFFPPVKLVNFVLSTRANPTPFGIVLHTCMFDTDRSLCNTVLHGSVSEANTAQFLVLACLSTFD
jgi:hypothetical protein